MRRIFFLVPSVASAKAIVDALPLARVEERRIHIVAREGTPLEDLPEAGVAQRSDLVPALEKGIAAGGLSGLLAGALAMTFPPTGLVLGGGALLGLTLDISIQGGTGSRAIWCNEAAAQSQTTKVGGGWHDLGTRAANRCMNFSDDVTASATSGAPVTRTISRSTCDGTWNA